MSTIQDVQKKNDQKFKTLKLLEKDTPRIYEHNKESELVKQNQLYEKSLDEINDLKDGNSRGDDRKRKHRRRN